MSDVYVAMSSAATKCDFVSTALNLFKDKIKAVKSVFVKPNLVSSEPYPTTTDPLVLDAVLSYLSDYDVAVGDGPAFDSIWDRKGNNIIRDHPLVRVCEKHGIEFMNLNKRKYARVKTNSNILSMSAVPSSYDLKISLPVLKSHSVCGLTGAIKNHFGLLKISDRMAMHAKKIDVHKGIAEISLKDKFDIFIVDAVETLIYAQEVRHGGEHAYLGYMLAGVDPVSIDCAGFELLTMVDPQLRDMNVEDIAHIKYAALFGVGSMDYTLTEV
jgi:uncharacterized protein (DUF362 family)